MAAIANKRGQGVPDRLENAVSDYLAALHRIRSTGGGNFTDADFALTAGWGHVQRGGIVMPARGRAIERGWTPEERDHFATEARHSGLNPEEAFGLPGETTFDVYLNDDAYWSNVWAYALGGYPVLKKWLSYRERDILGRPLRLEEVREVTDMIRRIAAILLMGDALDANYRAARDATRPWPLGS